MVFLEYYYFKCHRYKLISFIFISLISYINIYLISYIYVHLVSYIDTGGLGPILLYARLMRVLFSFNPYLPNPIA